MITRTMAAVALVLCAGCSFYNTLLGVRGPAVPVGAAPEEAMRAARLEFEQDKIPLMLHSRNEGTRVIESASFDPREVWSPDEMNERVTCIDQGEAVAIEGKIWIQFKVTAREYRDEPERTGLPTGDPRGLPARDPGRAFRSMLVLQYDGKLSNKDTKARCGPSASYAQSLLNRIAVRLPPVYRIADQKE
jgi:hypothetical protein